MSEQILRLGIDPSQAVAGSGVMNAALDRLTVAVEKAVSSLDRIPTALKKTGEESVSSAKKVKDSAEKIVESFDAADKESEEAAQSMSASWSEFAMGFNQAIESTLKVLGMFKGAYDFAAQRAEMAETAQHFKTQTISIGQDSMAMVNDFRKATENTITDTELMRSSMIAMRKGVSTDINELSQLYMVAKAKSEEGFGGTIQIFDQMVSAITTGRKQALLELGFISDSFKKAKDSAEVLMSRTEMLSAIMEQSADSVNLIASSGDSAADSFGKFETAVDRLGQSLNNLLPILVPVIDYLTETMTLMERYGQEKGWLAAPNKFMADDLGNNLKQAQFLEKVLRGAKQEQLELRQAIASVNSNATDVLTATAEEQKIQKTISGLEKEIALRKEAAKIAEKGLVSTVKGAYRESLDSLANSDIFKALTTPGNGKADKSGAKAVTSAIREAKQEQAELNKLAEEYMRLQNENADWAYKQLQAQKDMEIHSGALVINADLAWKALMKSAGVSTGFEDSLAKMIPMSADLAKNLDAFQLVAQTEDALKGLVGGRYYDIGKNFLSEMGTKKAPLESFLGPIENFVSNFYEAMSSSDKKEKMAVSMEKSFTQIFADSLMNGAKSGDWLSAIREGLNSVISDAFSKKFPVFNQAGGLNIGNLGMTVGASLVVNRLFGEGGIFGSRKVNGGEVVGQAADINSQVNSAQQRRWELAAAVGVSEATRKQLQSMTFTGAGYSWENSGDGIFSKKTKTYTLNAAGAQESLAKFSELQRQAEMEAGLRELEKAFLAIMDPMTGMTENLKDLSEALAYTSDPLKRKALELEIKQQEQAKASSENSLTSRFMGDLLSDPTLSLDDKRYDPLRFNVSHAGTNITRAKDWNTHWYNDSFSASKEEQYALAQKMGSFDSTPEGQLGAITLQQESTNKRVAALDDLRQTLKASAAAAENWLIPMEEKQAMWDRYREAEAAYWDTKMQVLDLDARMAEVVKAKEEEATRKAQETMNRFQEDVLGTLFTHVGELRQQGGSTVLVLSQGQPEFTSELQKIREGLNPEGQKILDEVVKTKTTIRTRW